MKSNPKYYQHKINSSDCEFVIQMRSKITKRSQIYTHFSQSDCKHGIRRVNLRTTDYQNSPLK